MTSAALSMSSALMPQEAAELPTQRFILLKSCYGKTGLKLRLEPCRDGRTGRYLGVAMLSDEEKRRAAYVVEPGVTFLEITDGYVFDLSDPRQATDWDWVKHCPQIVAVRSDANYHVSSAEESRSYEGSDNEFYVHDEEAELAGQERVFDRQYEALKAIHDLKGASAYYQFARLLGSNMETSSITAVRTYLQGQAQRNPDRVLAVQKDGSSKIKLFLYAALDKEVIRKRAGVFYYHETALGTTEEQALLWLGEDRNFTLVRAMQLEMYPAQKPKVIVSEANSALFDQALRTSNEHDAGALQPGEVAPALGGDEQADASDFGVEGEDDDLDANDPTRTADPAASTAPALPRAAQRRQARNA